MNEDHRFRAISWDHGVGSTSQPSLGHRPPRPSPLQSRSSSAPLRRRRRGQQHRQPSHPTNTNSSLPHELLYSLYFEKQRYTSVNDIPEENADDEEGATQAEGQTNKEENRFSSSLSILEDPETVVPTATLKEDTPLIPPFSDSIRLDEKRLEDPKRRSLLQCYPFGELYQAFLTTACSSWTLFLGLPLLLFAGLFLTKKIHSSSSTQQQQRIPIVVLAWCLVWATQHLMTLDLVRGVQWLFFEVFFRERSVTPRKLRQLLPTHSLATYLFVQARGWPLVLVLWSSINLGVWWSGLSNLDHLQHHHDTMLWHSNFLWALLLHEKPYSLASLGDFAAETYLRVWLAVFVSGSAISLQRMAVSIRLGRRALMEFQPKLERLLHDLCLLSEVADLARHVDLSPDDHFLWRVRTSAGMDGHQCVPSTRGEEDSGSVVFQGDNIMINNNACTSNSAKSHPSTRSNDSTDDEEDYENDMSTSHQRAMDPNIGSVSHIRSFLERWDEPKCSSSTPRRQDIRDVIRFRHALDQLIDTLYPFGETFGAVSNRDDCLVAAQEVYRRLLATNQSSWTSPTNKVNYAVILAALDNEEEPLFERRRKKRSLRRLLRPGLFGRLSLVEFVQSCDALYRRLRYFVASVDNASAIDRVLQDIVNVVFYCAL